MSQKQGQETSNYIDGLKVKISEKFKPPPRINLVMSYSQRLSLNKKIQDSMPSYDFVLEKRIKDKLEEYKNARKLNLEARDVRLEKIKEARKKFEEKLLALQKEVIETEATNSTTEPTKLSAQYGNAGSNYKTNSNVLMPTQATSKCLTGILTPTVSNKNEYVANTKVNDKSPFNISEFEADTSSPFDNMELKTINDMEELAMVLKSEEKSAANINNQYSTSQPYINYPTSQTNSAISSFSCNLQPSPAYSYNATTNGYYYDPYSSNFNYKSKFNYNSAAEQNDTLKSVPDIMKDLQTELNNSRINSVVNDDYAPVSSSTLINQSDQATSKLICEANKEELENPYHTLTKELQSLSVTISSMGFPLDRVARACSVLGNDHKKVSGNTKFSTA